MTRRLTGWCSVDGEGEIEDMNGVGSEPTNGAK
jgi:hypothetical protein